MSVLFAKIYDMSAEFDDRYVPEFEAAIARWDGIIAPSVGNAIVGLFADRVDKALDAGLSMLECFLGSQYAQTGKIASKMGIGIDTGTAIAQMGEGESNDAPYIVKNTRQIAVEVEALTQLYEVPLLITHRTFLQLVHPDDYRVRLIHRLKTDCQKEVIPVFEVFNGDAPEIQAVKLETKTQFEQGLFLYFMGFLEEAGHLFETCLEVNPGDRALQIYRDRCQNSSDVLI